MKVASDGEQIFASNNTLNMCVLDPSTNIFGHLCNAAAGESCSRFDGDGNFFKVYLANNCIKIQLYYVHIYTQFSISPNVFHVCTRTRRMTCFLMTPLAVDSSLHSILLTQRVGVIWLISLATPVALASGMMSSSS